MTSSDEPIHSVQAAFDELRHVSEETPCPYLPGRMARTEAFWMDHLDAHMYESLLARGFRRSGRVVYRPRCRHCAACRQLRIPVASFTPSRSMRRVRRRNQDVQVEVGEPVATKEKHALYCRYLDGQHDGTMSRSFESFRDFMYDSPLKTMEIQYRLGNRLVGVSIVDDLFEAWSSVYMYFDPDYANRSLGTFSILWEVQRCREEGRRHYYLGFHVANSKTMAYKARFRPNEVLVADHRWVSFER